MKAKKKPRKENYIYKMDYEKFMRIDNFYFVVYNINKSIEFYTKLFEEEPTNITENRCADWQNRDNRTYFGIISVEATGAKRVIGNNGVLGLYTDDIDKAFNKCEEIGAKILYEPLKIPNSLDNYTCFAIEDLDGNKIEIPYYDK